MRIAEDRNRLGGWSLPHRCHRPIPRTEISSSRDSITELRTYPEYSVVLIGEKAPTLRIVGTTSNKGRIVRADSILLVGDANTLAL